MCNRVQLLAFLGALALLVGNAAAGLAGGLAGGLAFAAATVLGAFAQVTGFDGLDMLHGFHLPYSIDFILTYFIIIIGYCQWFFSSIAAHKAVPPYADVPH